MKYVLAGLALMASIAITSPLIALAQSEPETINAMGVASAESVARGLTSELTNSHSDLPHYCEIYYRANDLFDELDALSRSASKEGHKDWSMRLQDARDGLGDALTRGDPHDGWYWEVSDDEEPAPCPPRPAHALSDTSPLQPVFGDLNGKPNGRTRALLDDGRVEMHRHHFRAALAAFRAAEATDATRAEIFCLEGRVLNRAGRYHEALERLQRAVALGDTQSHLSLEMARSLVMLNRPQDALLELTRYDQAHSGNPLTSGLMGHALLELGRLDEAEARLKDSMREPDLKPLALIYLAALEQRRGNTSRARENFDAALAVDPASPFSQVFRRALHRLAAKMDRNNSSIHDADGAKLLLGAGAALAFGGLGRHGDVPGTRAAGNSHGDSAVADSDPPAGGGKPPSRESSSTGVGANVSAPDVLELAAPPHYPTPAGSFFDMFVMMSDIGDLWLPLRDPVGEFGQSDAPDFTGPVQDVVGDLGNIEDVQPVAGDLGSMPLTPM